jgi:hypothetical protein
MKVHANAPLGPKGREVMVLEHAGPTATILTLSGWAALLATGATVSRSFRHPPKLPGNCRSGTGRGPLIADHYAA